jgi:hypothetical protein
VARAEQASCGLAITVATAEGNPMQEGTMTMQFPLTRSDNVQMIAVPANHALSHCTLI